VSQSDYVVSNGTGAAVRSDINGQLAAIVTQNSGATEPTTTYAYMRWADTTAGVMKMRNGANSSWITLYQLDGEWSTIAFENGTAAAPSIYFKDSGTDTGFYSPGANQVGISTGGTARLTIDSNGNVNIDSNTLYVDAANNRVGINTTPAFTLDVKTAGGRAVIEASGTGMKIVGLTGAGAEAFAGLQGNPVAFITDGAERARIDSSGRLLVGTSTSPSLTDGQYSKLHVVGNTNSANGDGFINIGRGALASTGLTTGTSLGNLQFTDSAGAVHAVIGGLTDGTTGTNDYPGRLVFSTTADGASSPTEAMRITSARDVLFGCTTNVPAANNVPGVAIATGSYGGYAALSRDSGHPLDLNRKTNDGVLILFKQDGTDEGSISVSGTTVSLSGAHLSRWSQLPGGATREEILRGTVLSNIDEMCGWGEEENEQLNRMKVSDVEGDPNVAGVFQGWDDDDDTYTDDFYCAMTGDFIIRIAEGVTVQRGDLLMSAGDGTAKPQDDDIIRSKTIAKVTSTHVTCTYDDGSYCVPCVLMAC